MGLAVLRRPARLLGMEPPVSATVFPYFDAPAELKRLAPGSGDDCDWIIVSEDYEIAQLLADRLAVFEFVAHVIQWRGMKTNVFITSHA